MLTLLWLCSSQQYSVYPIIWAAGRGHADIVKLLLQNGAKVNCSDKVRSREPDGNHTNQHRTGNHTNHKAQQVPPDYQQHLVTARMGDVDYMEDRRQNLNHGFICSKCQQINQNRNRISNTAERSQEKANTT